MEIKANYRAGDKDYTIATGALALQADGAVTVSCGGTVVLVTAVADKEREPNLEMLPLTVDYREKTSAAGKIPGGFFKREGRATEKETLTARLIDRPLRPLFPKGMGNDIQVIAWVLSADGENDPDILCLNGASAALMVSSIPFAGPVGAVQVGMIDGKFIINPTSKEMEQSDLDIVVAGSPDVIYMVEGGAEIVPEETVLKAIMAGHEALKASCQAQSELRRQIKPQPYPFELHVPPEELVEKVRAAIAPGIVAVLTVKEKQKRGAAMDELKKATAAKLAIGDSDEEKWAYASGFKAAQKFHMRRMILDKNLRSDGRNPEEIRPIAAQVGVFPRTHGSAVFTRGETQALVISTLGTKSDQQRVEGLEEERRKRFMLHYNFPPFCTGETAPNRGPKRREIGHGHLAERSLAPVLPSEEVFPYTIRVVSDILSSNGSSSMASICGGSLSLMDAGVPIKDAVAGIAMGLLLQEGKTVILTDILGSEDALGDMDFKVAGTKDGITGLQMDIKVGGITEAVMKQALSRARTARLRILEIMNGVQSTPRPEISPYAPKILSLQIDPEKIGLVIGPKGKNIKALEKTGPGVTIEIEDTGQVMVSSSDLDAAKRVKAAIEAMVQDVEVGDIYTGKVVSIKAFGAFVEIVPGKEGLVHISELAEERVAKVEDVVKEGDEVQVKVINIDNLGRIKLSRKQAIPEDKRKKADTSAPSRR